MTREIKTLKAKWNRLKRHANGHLLLTKLEERLLKNDTKALDLNPVLQTYPSPQKVTVTHAIPLKAAKLVRDLSILHEDSMHPEGVVEMTLTKTSPKETVELTDEITRF